MYDLLGIGRAALQAQQTRLAVTADNIANVNTTAFKLARVNFHDVLSQTIRWTSLAPTGVGVTNPSQIGLGIAIAAIDNTFTQGGLVATGRVTDVAIQGNGFFAVKDASDPDETKHKIYYTRDGSFYFNKDGYLTNTLGFRVLDVNGEDIQLDTTDPANKINTLSISREGIITGTRSDGTPITFSNGEVKVQIGLVYFSNPESLMKEGQNLYSPSVTTEGATDEAGTPLEPLQIMQNKIGAPGTEGRGTIESGSLEMSNVDLTTEFANLIITQRGYQANARVITTSDQMLGELIDLKR